MLCVIILLITARQICRYLPIFTTPMVAVRSQSAVVCTEITVGAISAQQTTMIAVAQINAIS